MRISPLTSIFLAAATIRAALCADAGALWIGKIQPLFDLHCVKCHGPLEQKSGLELDTADAAFKGGDDGKVIVPGQPQESRLYQYTEAGSDPHMPPKKQLSDTERGSIREWIIELGRQAGPKENVKAHEFASVADRVPVLYLAAAPDPEAGTHFSAFRALRKPFLPQQLLEAVQELAGTV